MVWGEPLERALTVFWFQDYRSVIENLPEDDRPGFFGLPANIERSSQRIVSSQVRLLRLQVPPKSGALF